MAIASGVYDLIKNLHQDTRHLLNIYLSAGSESYYFAQLLYQDYDRPLNLFTHNLAIIENYINYHQHLDNIKFRLRFGEVSCNELAILEKPEDNYAKTTFDAIIASATYIDEAGLYIESDNEITYKKEIFKIMEGTRILLLTLLEYTQPSKTSGKKRYKYGDISEFDYVVIPSE